MNDIEKDLSRGPEINEIEYAGLMRKATYASVAVA